MRRCLQILGTRVRHHETNGYFKVGRDWESPWRIFKDIQPVATMVEIKALIDPRLLVEIEAEAIVNGE